MGQGPAGGGGAREEGEGSVSGVDPTWFRAKVAEGRPGAQQAPAAPTLPCGRSHDGQRHDAACRASAEPCGYVNCPIRAPLPTLPDLARAAAEAVTSLCHCLRDCVREVEARGRLLVEVSHSRAAVWKVGLALPQNAAALRGEVYDMAEGCHERFARESWALRLLQIAAEATVRSGA